MAVCRSAVRIGGCRRRGGPDMTAPRRWGLGIYRMDEDFRKAALDYHRLPRPGKLAIEPTKRMATQRDLSLAYSPGVAAACEEIVADPDTAYDYTVRGNLVGVITNGTAVLGLGNIGALASKPVM